MTNLRCGELGNFTVHYPGRIHYQVCGRHLTVLYKAAESRGFHLIYERNHNEYLTTCQCSDNLQGEINASN